MTIFIVERYLPDVTLEQLTRLRHTTSKTINYFNAKGHLIHYIRSLFIPAEWRCVCIFEAPNAKILQEVNESAQFPFMRIVHGIELTSTSAPDES